MKFLLTLLATLFLALPAWAVDVQMGYDGNLVFEPNEITINAGCLLYTSPSPRDRG